MKKVLVFTYLPRHFKKMIPVIMELQRLQGVELSVLVMTGAEGDLARENGILFHSLDEFTDAPRTFDFDPGWGLEPLINAIDRINPDLFIAIEVNYILRNAVRYCSQKKIRSVIIQHGTPNKYSLHAFLPFEGDLFLAWGEFTKDYLISQGMNPDVIQITGGVSFDRTLALTADKSQIAAELGISESTKWVVFTTQGVGAGNMPSEDEIRNGFVETAKSFVQREGFELIFQVHPSQDLEQVRTILKAVPGFSSLICKYKDTEKLMKVADAVITFFSTTAIDAVLMKKPLLLINLTDDRDFYPFVGLGIATGAYTKEDIPSAVEQLLSHIGKDEPIFEKGACMMNYKNDGQALSRVMKVLSDEIGV